MDSNAINTLRTWLEELYPIGQTETGGVTRLGYSIEEDQMHEAFIKIAKGLGLETEVDSVGNTFVYIEGLNYKKYHLVGSHLDSVVNGGRYDGVVGVVGGLLVLNWIKEKGLNIPLKVVAFRCEESSGFKRATIGSSLITGAITMEDLRELRNDYGESLYDVFKIMGYHPEKLDFSKVKDYLELHIEQGRVLYEKGIRVGVVNAIAAPTRYSLKIIGRQDHSGATPMDMRKDALTAAAEVILALEALGQSERNNSSVATVGIVKNFPNVMNVVPGQVELGIDIRGINDHSVNKIEDQLKTKVDDIMGRRDLKYELKLISKSSPVRLSKEVMKNLSEAAERIELGYLEMPSGAGHDAMEFAEYTKTGMVFIPCFEGISHNIYEKAEVEDIYLGAKVIFEYLKEA